MPADFSRTKVVALTLPRSGQQLAAWHPNLRFGVLKTWAPSPKQLQGMGNGSDWVDPTLVRLQRRSTAPASHPSGLRLVSSHGKRQDLISGPVVVLSAARASAHFPETAVCTVPLRGIARATSTGVHLNMRGIQSRAGASARHKTVNLGGCELRPTTLSRLFAHLAGLSALPLYPAQSPRLARCGSTGVLPAVSGAAVSLHCQKPAGLGGHVQSDCRWCELGAGGHCAGL